MRSTLTRLGVLAALASVVAAGCWTAFAFIQVTSNLSDKSTFSPGQTGFVVVDEFQPVDAGQGRLEQRERAVARVSVVLSQVRFDPEQDLAALPANDRANLVQELRRNDLVILSDIPADRIISGNTLTSRLPSTSTDEFTFLVQRGNVGFTRNATYKDVPPLGDDQLVEIHVGAVNLREYGRLELRPINLSFSRGHDQDEHATISTGDVTVKIANLPVLNEQLGESNLAVIREAIR